jgi:hypothetical protein
LSLADANFDYGNNGGVVVVVAGVGVVVQSEPICEQFPPSIHVPPLAEHEEGE